MKLLIVALSAVFALSAHADSEHGIVNVTEKEGSKISDARRANFERRMAAIIMLDFAHEDSIEAEYSCSDSAVVKTFCEVTITSEDGAHGSYAVEDEGTWVQVLRKYSDLSN